MAGSPKKPHNNRPYSHTTKPPYLLLLPPNQLTMFHSLSLRRFFASFIFLVCSFYLSAQQPLPVAELRGVWIATVLNIDWPSAPGLPPERQQMEFDSLLDVLKAVERIMSSIGVAKIGFCRNGINFFVNFFVCPNQRSSI